MPRGVTIPVNLRFHHQVCSFRELGGCQELTRAKVAPHYFDCKQRGTKRPEPVTNRPSFAAPIQQIGSERRRRMRSEKLFGKADVVQGLELRAADFEHSLCVLLALAQILTIVWQHPLSVGPADEMA
jgi:hypothetical protein